MTKKILTCFEAYDIRDEININFDEDIAYRIGRAVAQHFEEGSVVVESLIQMGFNLLKDVETAP